LRFSSFFFPAALGELEFSLCGARIGRRRCERRTQRFRHFPNGARFWKNSNVFQRKLLMCQLAPLRGARYSSAAPPPAALPKKSARTDKIRKYFVSKKNAKILKNFYITQMAALVVVNPNRFRLPNAATKKAVRIVDYNYTIQIFQKKNNIKKSPKIPRKRL
jgi:hypothetical protein